MRTGRVAAPVSFRGGHPISPRPGPRCSLRARLDSKWGIYTYIYIYGLSGVDGQA